MNKDVMSDTTVKTIECSPEGCNPVIQNTAALKANATKLNWVITLITIFGTIGCSLLGTQSYQIPTLRAEMTAIANAADKKISGLESRINIIEVTLPYRTVK